MAAIEIPAYPKAVNNREESKPPVYPEAVSKGKILIVPKGDEQRAKPPASPEVMNCRE
jgi:hypothetical protein